MTGDHQHARREDQWDDLLGDEADVHDDLDVFGFAHGEADEADLGAPSQPVDAAGPCRPLSLIHISEPTRLIIRSRMPSSA